MSTPRTTSALRTILESCGELCESTAPEVLVKLCRKLETELAAEREKVATLRDAAKHFSWCATCAYDIADCKEGSEHFKALAETAPKEEAK